MIVRIGALRFLLFLVLSLAAVPAAAAERPGLDRWIAAANDFDRLAAVSNREGKLPRLSDPEAAALFRVLTDAGSAFAGPPFDPSDVQLLQDVQMRTVGIFTLYIEFGVDPASAASVQTQLTQRNGTYYQEELAPVIGFMADSAGHSLTAVQLFLAQLPAAEMSDERRQAIRSMRGGLETMLRAMVSMAPDSTLTPENRLIITSGVARNAETFASSLTLTQRRSMISYATMARDRAGPQSRAALNRLMAALATMNCEGMCAV